MAAPAQAKKTKGAPIIDTWSRKLRTRLDRERGTRLRLCASCLQPGDTFLGRLYSTDTQCQRCGETIGLGAVAQLSRAARSTAEEEEDFDE